MDNKNVIFAADKDPEENVGEALLSNQSSDNVGNSVNNTKIDIDSNEAHA